MLHARRIGRKMRAQVGHPVGAPLGKQRLQRAVILEPERHRRELEHLGVVVQGWFLSADIRAVMSNA